MHTCLHSIIPLQHYSIRHWNQKGKQGGLFLHIDGRRQVMPAGCGAAAKTKSADRNAGFS
ncbi:hypothetical protein B14911_19320 [Bacillus sp. NRRL B-14911]|uniref:Uncharacterized protein n=1 Tax=Bacillus infantis NRRL B-14911 TaxID=1367477 RepID=U5L4V9_9BACI|nr:hypothetical protein N288_01740 [Bacillus infantis NRRL B-14911]EAR67577.1 hypothetical protein B14911_19320 [Bacillus sp. NRRL B-14911]